MQTLANPQELAGQCRNWHTQGQSIALVPTMGCYHAGHEALMRYGRTVATRLVVSLFVNPAQFGPGEDLDAYPRDEARDEAVAEACGADVLFMPQPGDIYMPDHAAWVDVPDMAAGLCGKSRPTHFRGVCTVVLKLLLLTLADVAVFGEKDWQQQAIIRRMARDLGVQTRIESRPVVRDPDGLALSSRNVYLTVEERAQAPEIRRALRCAQEMASRGEKNAAILQQAVLRRWAEHLSLGRLDYLAVVRPDTLVPLSAIDGPALMACAVQLGRSRLIDNILLHT
ncbi:pantoate--beta-alanine ligase [Candidatus Desulfovibrio trichonymphae]|uniref:Pantothenate synthetase n=1 Tax=Candidatus Desulfovibrio trichonymphae TaxID=1725232 RepID=A0A1J1DPG0_9BACT|nr:pantoate--beta-alanine ligase [Candidatus Desulfovibrio trichonymphae]BAV91727.1 pantoate--beta-alanine ligase [Candidatus Desulfovibrio trichonymphae]